MDRTWLTAQLLDLISKRTGYPKEMLALDQDLEADSDIDSIKRVEILAAWPRPWKATRAIKLATRNGKARRPEEPARASLIICQLCARPRSREAAKPPQGFGPRNGAKPDAAPTVERRNKSRSRSLNGYEHLQVQRALVQLVDAPLPSSTGLLLPRGVVVFTDDGRGIAREMAEPHWPISACKPSFGSHAAREQRRRRCRLSLRGLDGSRCGRNAVEGDSAAVQGPIAGLVHLLPLAEPPRAEGPMTRMQREVKSLYLLARGLGQDLRQAGSAGPAVLLAATGLGGGLGFGEQPLPDNYFAGHGGVIGFVKCLASRMA